MRPNRILSLALFACLSFTGATVASAKSPLSLDVLQRDGYGSVQLIKGVNSLFVPTEINGNKTKLLLDTGFAAPGIGIGVNPAQFHIVPEKGVGGMMSASGAKTAVGHGMAQSVVMGNVHIQGAPIYFGGFARMGFVGRGFLRTNSAIIDLGNLRMYLRPPGVGRRADLSAALKSVGMAQAAFTETARGSFVVDVELNGTPAQMALDTGAQVTEIDARFAKQAKMNGWGRRNVRRIDIAGQVSNVDLAGPKALTIAGVPVRPPTILLSHFAGYDVSGGKMVGVLGLDVLGQDWGIIDFGQRKLYFAGAK